MKKNSDMRLEIIYKQTKDLLPYAKNSRKHSQKQIDQIAQSINEFGFNKPIAIDDNNTIIAGHGTLQAAKKLGMDKVPVVILKHMTEEQKKAYIIADNRIGLNSEWNEQLLLEEINTLFDSGFDLSLTGFDDVEINDLLDNENINIDADIKDIDTSTIEPTFIITVTGPLAQQADTLLELKQKIENIENVSFDFSVVE